MWQMCKRLKFFFKEYNNQPQGYLSLVPWPGTLLYPCQLALTEWAKVFLWVRRTQLHDSQPLHFSQGWWTSLVSQLSGCVPCSRLWNGISQGTEAPSTLATSDLFGRLGKGHWMEVRPFYHSLEGQGHFTILWWKQEYWNSPPMWLWLFRLSEKSTSTQNH